MMIIIIIMITMIIVMSMISIMNKSGQLRNPGSQRAVLSTLGGDLSVEHLLFETLRWIRHQDGRREP